MQYEFHTDIRAEEHDAFVEAHPLCNLLQSSKWALVKDNWQHTILGVKDESNCLVASTLCLIKKLPFNFTMFYLPRGPILDYENKELVLFFFQEIKKYAKKHHCLFIKFDPAILIREFSLDKTDQPYCDKMDSVLENLKQANAIYKGCTLSIKDTIQPRFHAIVHASNQLYEELPKSTRKALSIVEKKKIQLEACGAEAVEEFANVMRFTEERKHISLRDEAYFRKIMDLYKDNAVIYLARLPLQQLLEESNQKLRENEDAIANCPENAKKKKFTLDEQHCSLVKEIEMLEDCIKDSGESTVIAGALCVRYGYTSELLYAGMNEKYKRYMAPYATFYACMQWSFSQGCQSCNMGGIEGTLNDGLTTFKAKFHPVIHEFIGEFDLPVNRLFYHASEKAYEIRKRKGAKAQDA